MINRFQNSEPEDTGAIAIKHAQRVKIDMYCDLDGEVRFTFKVEGEMSADDFQPGVDPLDFCRALLSVVKRRPYREDSE